MLIAAALVDQQYMTSPVVPAILSRKYGCNAAAEDTILVSNQRSLMC